MRIVHLFFSALLVFAVACGGDSNSGGGGSESDDIKSGTTASTIDEAVLVDLYQGGELVAACSGSLIAPTVVLTAGHCVHGFDGWKVTAPFAKKQSATAESAATYDWKVEGEEVDPSKHDLGLVFLDSAITLAKYPAIATAPLDDGTKVTMVGRIKNGTLSNSDLYESKPTAVELGTDAGFPFDYASKDIIESGDSGGPDFVTTNGARIIVAVNSGADDATQVLARTDLVASWIASQVKKHAGGGGSSSTSSSGGASGCSHSECASGKKLAASCSDCAATICASDDYCCATKWDDQCASEAAEVCDACI